MRILLFLCLLLSLFSCRKDEPLTSDPSCDFVDDTTYLKTHTSTGVYDDYTFTFIAIGTGFDGNRTTSSSGSLYGACKMPPGLRSFTYLAAKTIIWEGDTVVQADKIYKSLGYNVKDRYNYSLYPRQCADKLPSRIIYKLLYLDTTIAMEAVRKSDQGNIDYSYDPATQKMTINVTEPDMAVMVRPKDEALRGLCGSPE